MIYIHVPFCRSFCTYCGFYSELCAGKEPQMACWRDSVLEEINDRREAIASTRLEGPDTLYIGGGTPSVLPSEILESIVGALGPSGYEEFTVEVNPDDVTSWSAERLRRLRGLGANRVSMGVQSFDDGILHWMNRRHNAAQAVGAFNMLRSAGFGNISVDLIFGVPSLTDGLWEETVRKTVGLGPEHISAYALSVEEGSALQELSDRGEVSLMDDEGYSRQYGILCRILAEAGYEHYEISNFCKPGRRAVHNSAYWSGRSYVGLGPGAHSYDSSRHVRSWNSLSPVAWSSEFEVLSADQMAEERVMLSMRTSDGLDEEELRSLAPQGAVDRLLDEGILERRGRNIRIPEERFFVCDGIISGLVK